MIEKIEFYIVPKTPKRDHVKEADAELNDEDAPEKEGLIVLIRKLLKKWQ